MLLLVTASWKTQRCIKCLGTGVKDAVQAYALRALAGLTVGTLVVGAAAMAYQFGAWIGFAAEHEGRDTNRKHK
jgi:hypothetical protein